MNYSTLSFFRSIIAVFALVLVGNAANAQTTFQKSYGGTQEEYIYAIEQLADGGYIMCGRTFSFGVGGWDALVVRLKPSGDTAWTRTYGNVGYDEFQSIKKTADGGFILCGQTDNVDALGDILLVKTDTGGVVTWSKTYGASGTSDYGYSVRQTTEGGYIIAGATKSAGAGLFDVTLIKTTSTGTVSWSKAYGGASDDQPRCVEETSDGYIVCGYTQSYGSGAQMYLLKTNTTGVVSWSKTFGGSNTEVAYTVKQLGDGSYILGGYTDSYGAGNFDLLLIKLTSTGTISWSKTYGGTAEDRGLGLRITSDNGYIFSGFTYSFGGGSGDYYLVKTDASGTVAWSKAFGGSALDQAYNVIQTTDGGYAVAGYANSYGQGMKEAYVVKTNATGVSNCNEVSPATTTNSPTVTSSTGVTENTGNSTTGNPAVAVRRTSAVINTQCYSAGVACTVDASFTSSQTTICVGTTVNFTNTSTNATSYKWKENGVQFSTSTNASRTFNTAGNYIIRLVASDATCSDSVQTTITVNPTVIPQVVVTANPTGSICAGQCVTFTATPINGGSFPAYQWHINGSNVGTNSSTYTGCTLQNGDFVSVTITSNSPCASPVSATSNTVIMQVSPVLTPAVTITSNPSGPICAGQCVTFTATPTNGGAAPTYQWYNGATPIGGQTGSTYTTCASINGDVISVRMTSNAPCANPVTATSNTITMQVSPAVTPAVSITANPSGPICAGQCVTFTAHGINGGTNATYTWQINGSTAQTGINDSVFTRCTLTNNDVVKVVLQSSSSCASPTSVISNTITMAVNPTVTSSVSITSNPVAPICPYTCVTFTATPVNGGANPGYQWQVNGSSIAGATSSTYTNCNLLPGAQVKVVMTSNAACPNPASVTSNPITIDLPIATIIAGGQTTFCQGDSVVLTANAGLSYLWFPGGATTQSITVHNAGNYAVKVTNANGCADTSVATQVTVNNLITPSVTITADPNPVCAGEDVEFTATPVNGGTPTYIWNINGFDVPNSNHQVVTFNAPDDGDVVTVTMVSSLACAEPDSVTSNPVTVIVNTPVVPVITQNGNVLTSSMATNNVWYIVGSPAALSNQQNYTVIQTGDYFVIYVDANGCIGISDTLHVIINGIEESLNKQQVLLYPNPATNAITVETTMFSAGRVQLDIKNMLGQTVYTFNDNAQPGWFKRTIELNTPAGIYFLTLRSNIGVTSKKIEIVK